MGNLVLGTVGDFFTRVGCSSMGISHGDWPPGCSVSEPRLGLGLPISRMARGVTPQGRGVYWRILWPLYLHWMPDQCRFLFSPEIRGVLGQVLDPRGCLEQWATQSLQSLSDGVLKYVNM